MNNKLNLLDGIKLEKICTMNKKILLKPLIALFLLSACKYSSEENNEYVFVKNGEPVDVVFTGDPWEKTGNFISGTGTNHYLVAGKSLAGNDFHIHLKLIIDSLNFSAASFVLDGNHFGFDAKSVEDQTKSSLFLEGPLFGKTISLPETSGKIAPGVPFTMELICKNKQLSWQINDEQVYTVELTRPFQGTMALRPWRNSMKVCDFSASGNLSGIPDLNYIFKSGTSGYNTFRIPAIVASTRGTLLAFAEGRKSSSSDTGDIDLVLKRSEDNGLTWSDIILVWDDSMNVCGNPAPVVDQKTGTIWLLSTWNLGSDHESEIIKQTSEDTRRIFVMSSTDDGLSWSNPVEITSSVKKENWTWYATGPCHGIQLESQAFSGRLVIPCDHIEAGTNKYFSHIIFSGDQGKTWKLGGKTPQDQVNECTVAERMDGSLVLNMRNYNRSQKARKVSVSTDGGMTWSDIRADQTLVEPICQASLLTWSLSGVDAGKTLFLNPADENRRVNMTLRISNDWGNTWIKSKTLHAGPSAYSDLVRTPDGMAGCLYEAGYVWPYEGIVFERHPVTEQ